MRNDDIDLVARSSDGANASDRDAATAKNTALMRRILEAGFTGSL